MSTVDEIFAKAARKTGTYDLDGITLNLIEPSLKQRLDWTKREKAKSKDSDKATLEFYGLMITTCCKEMSGVEIDKIIDEWSYDHIVGLGEKISGLAGLNEEKKT